jgi:hypothetical protein
MAHGSTSKSESWIEEVSRVGTFHVVRFKPTNQRLAVHLNRGVKILERPHRPVRNRMNLNRRVPKVLPLCRCTLFRVDLANGCQMLDGFGQLDRFRSVLLGLHQRCDLFEEPARGLLGEDVVVAFDGVETGDSEKS